MQQTSEEELLNNAEASNTNGQAQPITYSEEDYKNLQAEFTKRSQREIALAVKLAEKDKKSILDIDDRKLQEKVIKELYGFSNLDELKLIHGDDFFNKKDDGSDSDKDEDDRLYRIEKELKLTKYQKEKEDIDREIQYLKDKTPLAFEDNSVEEKIRDELKYISTELPTKERINRASTIVLGVSQSLWNELKTTSSGANAQRQVGEDKKIDSSIEEEFKRIFKRK